MAKWLDTGEIANDFIVNAVIDKAIALNVAVFDEAGTRKAITMLEELSCQGDAIDNLFLFAATQTLRKRLEDTLSTTPANPLPHPPVSHRNGGRR